MPAVTPFISYVDRAEEAVALYVSLFPGSRVGTITRYGAGAPLPEGSVMTVEFELAGRPYVALNGGDHFQLTDAFSLTVACETQAEIDHYWTALTKEGGEEGPCGWLRDRFGLWWQINPPILGQMLGDPDREKAARVMAAMLQMKKIDIAALQRAYDGDHA